jgi:RING finger protein 113A
MVSYKSKRTTDREGPSDMGATAVLQIETEVEKDAQAIFENALRINKVQAVCRFRFSVSLIETTVF